ASLLLARCAAGLVAAGVLMRMLQSDPQLSEVGAILFDEFHERNLDADLALALALDLQVGRTKQV
ncbi:MAG: hypothetical protein ACT6T3_22370, partial [Agrobacterium sp.]|uniref:hypothetical protein n=1 Tax=Agrobacterium sp. TaxID=361 RepID=UPI004033DC34